MKTITIDGIEYNLTPKALFKKGDFVVIQETTYLISKIEGLNVTLSCNGRECLFDIDVLKSARLWDITKDAKDGDVIFYDDGWTCIFKRIHGIWYSSYCFITADGKFFTGYERHAVDAKLNGNANPATKEQRDTLMKAMADAGYTFDFEKKELKKIEQEWTGEDEKMFISALWHIENSVSNGGKDSGEFEIYNWLKSLKNRLQLQSQWKPNDEQIGVIEAIINNRSFQRRHLVSLYEQLKKLREK